MEYLTIQDPRPSHFRGMEPYSADAYGVRSKDAAPRPLKASSYDHGRSSTSPHQRFRPSLGLNSSHDSQRWAQPPAQEPAGLSRAHPGALTGPAAQSGPTTNETYGNAKSTYSASQYSPPDRTRLPASDWQHPAQPVPVRPSTQAVHALQANEEQQSIKLPSFTSLVSQLDREAAEPKGASSAVSSSVATDVAWKRQEPGASFAPLEPHAFQFTGHAASSGRNNMSNLSSTHQIANSEPASPDSFANHPYSPRLRAQSPRYRTHSRRSSDYRARAFSNLPAPVAREAHVAPYPTSHHRTQTYPSFPPHPSLPAPPPAASRPDPFQQPQLQPPSLNLGPSNPYGAPIQPPAQHSHASHSRSDSLLTASEDYRFHSGSFFANATSGTHYQRKRRGNLPKDATKILRQWFDEHVESPYPSEDVKNMLCMRTGLQMSQVNNWFINARRRLPRADTSRNRRERDSTDVSEGSPSRDRPPHPPSAYV